MRYAALCLTFLIVISSSAEPLLAAEKAGQAQTLNKKKKIIVPPGGLTNTVGTHGGVMELNASDCRLNGGTVVTPGDDRCGKTGAQYCRYSDGNAACLTEQ
jgi:hypothetical protein